MRFIGIAIICLLSFLQVAGGAYVYGTVYSWETLEPLPKAIVTVNSTPAQRMVAEDGHYSFNLSPGTYLIQGFYYKKGELQLYDEEVVVIKGEGNYVVDLILFPPLPELPEEPELEFNIGAPSYDFIGYVVASAVGIGMAGYLIWRFRFKKKEKAEEPLPEDLEKTIEIIKSENGRITQKELRKRLGLSEAKVSLLIADLERRGIVEKVKKGRGNIIFLRKER